MQKYNINYFFSFLALLAAFSILSVSLVHASQSEIVSNDQTSTASLIYFDNISHVTPDNKALYAIAMIMDKVHLKSASAEKKPIIQVNYARNRLQSAIKLLREKKYQLSYVTLLKSLKYLLDSLENQERLDQLSDREKRYIYSNIRFITKQSHDLKKDYIGCDLSQLDSHILTLNKKLQTNSQE